MTSDTEDLLLGQADKIAHRAREATCGGNVALTCASQCRAAGDSAPHRVCSSALNQTLNSR